MVNLLPVPELLAVLIARLSYAYTVSHNIYFSSYGALTGLTPGLFMSSTKTAILTPSGGRNSAAGATSILMEILNRRRQIVNSGKFRLMPANVRYVVKRSFC